MDCCSRLFHSVLRWDLGQDLLVLPCPFSSREQQSLNFSMESTGPGWAQPAPARASVLVSSHCYPGTWNYPGKPEIFLIFNPFYPVPILAVTAGKRWESQYPLFSLETLGSLTEDAVNPLTSHPKFFPTLSRLLKLFCEHGISGFPTFPSFPGAACAELLGRSSEVKESQFLVTTARLELVLTWRVLIN